LKGIFFIATILLGIFLSIGSAGQGTAAKPKPVKDTSAPKLMVRFGPYADSAKVPASVIKQIIKSELKITDSKGSAYTLIGFSFSWKRKDMTDDFKTGVPKTVFLYNSVDIKSDPHIPASWQEEIKENVQAKEEFRFDEILVQSTKTKKLYKTSPVTLFVL
jgi:hypothetical protein